LAHSRHHYRRHHHYTAHQHAIKPASDWATAWHWPSEAPIRASNVATGLAHGLEHMLASMRPHPAGCPATQFCGCGTSVRVFGHPIRDLYLAANWFRFPRAMAAPGMVAVRRHHVFYIEGVNGDGTVTAYDPNSGQHLTRIHRVRLAGYTVVDPHGSRWASRQ
jgi:hypothetical protein